MDDIFNTLQPTTTLNFTLTAAEATAKLAEMTAALAPAAPPLEPANASDARRRMDLLVKDRDWGARFFDGHAAERREFTRLQELIAAGDSIPAPDAASAGVEFDFSSEDQASRQVLNGTVAMLRDAGIGDTAISQALTGKPETPEAIAAVKVLHNQRMTDPEWRKKLLNGDATAKREWMLMSIVLAGAPA